MDDFDRIAIDKEFRIDIAESKYHPPQEVQKVIDKIWEKEKLLKGGGVYDGLVLGCVAFDQGSAMVEFTDYRVLFAMHKEPKLIEALHIMPIGISGICIADGKYLLGKRAENLAYYPGMYELAPAGSLDTQAASGQTINVEKQCYLELEEETGIKAQYVNLMTPRFLVHDRQTGMIDIVLTIDLINGISGRVAATLEYPELFWLSEEELQAHMAQHHRQYVPLTMFLSGFAL